MNTFNQGGPENLKNPSRRGFLGKMLAGVAGVALGGVALKKVGNKYMDAENKLNSLHESLKGQEENPEKAQEVIGLLLDEMNSANPPLQKIRLSSTSAPTEMIGMLRDFITDHLNSKAGRHYSLKEEVMNSGYYTKENLSLLRITAGRLSEKASEKKV